MPSVTSPKNGLLAIHASYFDQFNHPFVPSDAEWQPLDPANTDASLTPTIAGRQAWLNTGTTPGTYTVRVEQGNQVGELVVEVSDQTNQAPEVVSVLSQLHDNRLALSATGTDSDGDNNLLTYTWAVTSVPTGLSISDVDLPSWNGSVEARNVVLDLPGPGIYGFTVVASDGALFSDPYAVTFDSVQVPTSLRVESVPYPAATSPNDPIDLRAVVLDQYGGPITDFDGSFTWDNTFSTASLVVDAVDDSVATFTAANRGGYFIGVTATRASDGQVVGAGQVQFSLQVIDQVAPIGRLLSPPSTGEPFIISRDFDVFGVVQDLNANDTLTHSLRLEPRDGGEPIVLVDDAVGRVGSIPADGGILATLHAASLPNGVYDLVLHVDDGQSATPNAVDRVSVEIKTDVKLGNLVLPFVDLTLDVPGQAPIEVRRVYDSSRAHERLAFGYGWRLELDEAEVETDARGDTLVGSEPPALRENDPVLHRPTRHRETHLRLPTGRRGIFKAPSVAWASHGVRSSSQLTAAVPRCKSCSRAGGQSELVGPDHSDYPAWDDVNSYTLIRDGSFFKVGANGYNPANAQFGNRYYVTTTDGTRYEIEADSGRVRSRTDANGNPTTFIDNSGGDVASAGGLTLRVLRNGSQVSEAQVIDAGGGVLRRVIYTYGDAGTPSEGELVSVKDVAEDVTTFAYGPGHRLETITDARDVDVLAADYDAAGRLASVSDADGNASLLDSGFFTGTTGLTASTDAEGNDTEFVYDRLGQVVREIRAERDTNTGLVTRYLVTVREYEYNDAAIINTREGGDEIGWNRPHTLREFEPFSVPAPDLSGKRLYLAPTRQVREVSFKNYTDALPASSDTDLWKPVYERVLAPDGVSWLTTWYEADPADGADHAYHELGGVQRVVDPYGQVTRNEYDDAGNLLWSRNHLGEETRYEYTDGIGDLDKGLLLRTFTVDANGVELAELSSNTYVTSGTHLGRLDTSTDAAGLVTRYTYQPDGSVAQTFREWDNNGTLVSISNGLTEYDAAGRAVRSIDNITLANPVGTVSHTYHGDGGLVVANVEQYGPNLDATDPTTLTLYDAAGRVIATQRPDGTETRTAYDALGRAEWQAEQFASTTQASFNYSEQNPQISWSNLDNASRYVVTRTIYDALGRAAGTEQYADARIPLEEVGGLYRTLPAVVSASDRVATTRTVYDGRGRAVEQVNADGLRVGTVYWFDGSVRFSGPLKADAPADWHVAAAYDDPYVDPAAVNAAAALHFRDARESHTSSAGDGRGDVAGTLADRWNANRVEVTGQLDLDDSFTLTLTDPIDPTTSETVTVDLSNVLTSGNAQTQRAAAQQLADGINSITPATKFNVRAIREPNSAVLRLVPIDTAAPSALSYVLTGRGIENGTVRAAEQDRPALRIIGTTGEIIENEFDANGNFTGVSTSHDSAFRRSTLWTDALGRPTLTIRDEVPGSVRTLHPDGTETLAIGGVSGNQAQATSGLNLNTPADLGATMSVNPGSRHSVSVERRNPDTEPARVTHEVYDAAGRLVAAWRPEVTDASTGSQLGRAKFQYVYDAAGNRLSQKDPQNRETLFAVDDEGRPSGRTLPLGQQDSITYDARGRVATTVAFDGVVTEHVYDDETYVADVHDTDLDWPASPTLGRMVEERVFESDTASSPSLVHRYAYDALGRRTAWGRWQTDDAAGSPINLQLVPDRLETWTHDAVTGNVASHLQPEGLVTYGYDPATGRLTSLDAPGTEADVGYTYDDHGRLRRIDTTAGTSWYHYDALGRRVLEEHPNDVDYTRTYDTAGRLLEQEAGTLRQTYAYFGNGQRRSVSESGTGSTNGTTTWTYDAIGRLIREDIAGTVSEWGYDLASNRIEQLKDGVTTTYVVDDNDRLVEEWADGTQTASYSYDDNGSTLLRDDLTADDADVAYAWNVLGQPRASTAATTAPPRAHLRLQQPRPPRAGDDRDRR